MYPTCVSSKLCEFICLCRVLPVQGFHSLGVLPVQGGHVRLRPYLLLRLLHCEQQKLEADTAGDEWGFQLFEIDFFRIIYLEKLWVQISFLQNKSTFLWILSFTSLTLTKPIHGRSKSSFLQVFARWRSLQKSVPRDLLNKWWLFKPKNVGLDVKSTFYQQMMLSAPYLKQAY